MKRYIKPVSKTIDLQVEDYILSASPDTYKDEVGNAYNNGIWLAPKRIWDCDLH